ncbi:MAG: UDP-N-acetylglucosamine 2-epimerase [Berkelbacteria bacterium GW2011_GWA1_36_9]|uniref:UDP-N-acetylglucosamine 2-epimerase n=1 Tax=Berkelbacteria bacterium GW2011_GWA1_36_9 TaxID=1618331 RepID=A0A0G0FY88_9BACT|nr:MAG: UDP-N-acetylglucosamine 2-epimerase [Berkelbacteria bacterium GW2011_GWA1_36_9]
MKIMTILGTRPEIIRLSRVIPLLDQYSEHIVVHTDQNYDKRLKDIFFQELNLRQPNIGFVSKSSTAMEQIGKIIVGSEKILNQFKPDRLLILGDTNSAISAFVAKRMGIKVFHMEAGNRCFDNRVPEEVNRRVIDHATDIAMPYTERSRANLLREGIASDNIFVTGNPIKEVLDFYESQISASPILKKFKLESKKYFLVTLHREENVDIESRLISFVQAFNLLVKEYKLSLIWSVHPRTARRLEGLKIKIDSRIQLSKPFGLFDFVRLEKNAFGVLSDSGTVQEECCIFKVPTVTLRDVTERPETIEVGSNFLAGCDPKMILNGVKLVTQRQLWQPPSEYLVKNVSQTIANIVLGYYCEQKK